MPLPTQKKKNVQRIKNLRRRAHLKRVNAKNVHSFFLLFSINFFSRYHPVNLLFYRGKLSHFLKGLLL